MTNNAKHAKGFWFYGLSGSGKTYATQFLAKKIEHSFLIDGDMVRQFVSADLSYSEKDRTTQINRLFGIGLLALENNYFPLISSVFMTHETLLNCHKKNILVMEIRRDVSQLKKVRSLYAGCKNVVGVDIKRPDLNTLHLDNDGTPNFNQKLLQYAKPLTI